MARKRKQVISTGKQYHGLKNQGATCYLNSVLQVLYMTKDFREAVSHSQQGSCIDHHLRSVFNTLTNEEGSTLQITKYLGITKVNEQHDAAECFDNILSSSSSKASQIFKGELTHKNTCSKCEQASESNSSFWSLPLTLSEMEYYCVTEGIKQYFQESKLCGENQLYCHECNDKTDSSIRLEMHHHPDVLTLLLKRFKFDYHCMDYVKIKCKVKIPDTLRIPTTGDQSLEYQLYAFVEHSGELRSGHYTVKIKPPDDDKWFTFNDKMVTPSHFQPFQVDKEESSSTAYLLFYRKTTDPSDGDSCGASTSGYSKSNEPPRKYVKTSCEKKGEKKAAGTEYNEGRDKTGNKQRKNTESDDDCKSTECKQAREKDIDSSIKCIDTDGQNREEQQVGPEKQKNPHPNCNSGHSKKKGGKNQKTHNGRKGKRVVKNQHMKECEECDRKQDASNAPSKNCSTGLHDEREAERKDQRQLEEIEGKKLQGQSSETGGELQISRSPNVDENRLNQNVLQEKQQTSCNKHESQDSAVINDLSLNQCMLKNDSSSETFKTTERFGDEAINKDQQIKANDEARSKVEISDRLSQNIPALSGEGAEEKNEAPDNDTCSQTREKSAKPISESETNQTAVLHDTYSQDQLQPELQQKMSTVTREKADQSDANNQTDTKGNDGESSGCISMRNQKDLLEEQLQRNEESSTGSENSENVSEIRSLTESNRENMADTENQQLGGNGSGGNKKTKKKGKNKTRPVLASSGLVYLDGKQKDIY